MHSKADIELEVSFIYHNVPETKIKKKRKTKTSV